MQEKPAHRTVAMVLFNDVLLLDVTGPMDAFAIANRFLPAERQYRLLTLAEGPAAVRGSCGLKVMADRRLEDLPESVDLLLVPGGPGAYDIALPGIERWLPQAVRRARRFGAICTGVFLLGPGRAAEWLSLHHPLELRGAPGKGVPRGQGRDRADLRD